MCNETNNLSNSIIGLLKKMKKHKRDALFPLYVQHADYLLRVIKTLDEKDDSFNLDLFTSKLETFRDVATCHEIALNKYSSLNIETHQNSRGKEREYTIHPKAKNIRRDLRVKIIWQLVIDNIDNLDQYQIYDKLYEIKLFNCPVCGETIISYEKEILDYHTDGTANWVWRVDNMDYCNCLIIHDADDYTNFQSNDIEFFYDLSREFALFDGIFEELAKSELVVSKEEDNDIFHFTKDEGKTVVFLTEKVEKLMIEDDLDIMEEVKEFCEMYYIPITLRNFLNTN